MCYSKQLQGQLHSIHKNPVYISELDITATESRFKDQMTQLFILQRAESSERVSSKRGYLEHYYTRANNIPDLN